MRLDICVTVLHKFFFIEKYSKIILKKTDSGDVGRQIHQLNQQEDAMISEMEYRKGNYIARMAVLDTDNRRFRGMVLIRKHGDEEIEKFCAVVESDNVEDAMEEARALAHKILNERVIYGHGNNDE